MAPSPLFAQAKAFVIGDCTYTVEPLGFVEGRKALVKLTNVIGPALQSLDPRKSANQAEALEGFLAAIGTLLATLKDDDLVYFEGLYSKRTLVKLPDGREPVLRDVLEQHFTGERFAHYFAWLGHALWGTYGDFFTVGLGKLTDLLPAQGPGNP